MSAEEGDAERKRQRTEESSVANGVELPVCVKFVPLLDAKGEPLPKDDKHAIERVIGEAAGEQAAKDALQAYWRHVHGFAGTGAGASEGLEDLKSKSVVPGGNKWVITLQGCEDGSLDELAFETLHPKETIRDWLEMLVNQKQLVFSGPPGCGKTRVAVWLAMWLLRRDTRRHTLVQFSSSYTYEDFVQGPRAVADEKAIQETIDDTKERVKKLANELGERGDEPVLNAAAAAAAQVIGTSKTFRAAPGPLVALSDLKVSTLKEPSAEPARPPAAESDFGKLLTALGATDETRKATAGKLKVLVIDEMNRAAVANVFGECFFLLENRGSEITLRHSTSGDKFALDENLLIIGTMNLADRNVDARMDVAFVQRFCWAELSPADGLLPAYLRSLERERVAGAEGASKWLPGLVDAWNGVLADKGKAEFAIGPRFFLKRSLYKDEDVAPSIIKLWKIKLFPYLQHVFRSSNKQAEYKCFEEMLEKGLAAPKANLSDPMKHALTISETMGDTGSKLKLPAKPHPQGARPGGLLWS